MATRVARTALVPGGLLIVNATLIEAEPRRKDIEISAIPCTALARAGGDDRFVSIVAPVLAVASASRSGPVGR